MNNKKINKLVSKVIVLSTVIFAAFMSVSAQRYSIKTADGYLFIQNGKDVSFTCEVKGTDIMPVTAGENPTFVTDGTLIQILLIVSKSYDPTGKVQESKLLELHRDWELEYLAGVFGSKLVSETQSMSAGERSVLYWQFKRPKYVTEYDRDIYMTTLIGRDVFGLSSPGTIGVESKVYQDRHIEIMKTLKVSKTPFDVKKLSEDIRKGVAPGS